MQTTTIRLPEELKARVAAAAERAGTSPHSFMLEAIAEKAEQDERRREIEQAAESRYAKIIATGRTIPWSEMRSYLQGRASGAKPKRPPVRKLAR
jgi:predicted transcriptional regulator